MKRVMIIAGLLIAGILIGGLATAAFHAMSNKNPPAAPVAASAPQAVASAQVIVAAPPAAAASPAQGSHHVAAARARHAEQSPQRAEVLDVTPINDNVKTTRTECHDVQVQREAPVSDEHRITGTVVGSALGGVLGHQVGGGRGKEAATAIGAIAGGIAGNQAQKSMQQRDTYTDTERRCMEVPVETAKVVGYDVRYRYEGHIGTVRMSHDPGSWLSMRDGQPVIN